MNLTRKGFIGMLSMLIVAPFAYGQEHKDEPTKDDVLPPGKMSDADVVKRMGVGDFFVDRDKMIIWQKQDNRDWLLIQSSKNHA